MWNYEDQRYDWILKKEGDDLKSYSNIGKDFAEAVYFNDGFKHTDFK